MEQFKNVRESFEKKFKTHIAGNFGFGKFGKIFGGKTVEDEQTKEPKEESELIGLVITVLSS